MLYLCIKLSPIASRLSYLLCVNGVSFKSIVLKRITTNVQLMRFLRLKNSLNVILNCILKVVKIVVTLSNKLNIISFNSSSMLRDHISMVRDKVDTYFFELTLDGSIPHISKVSDAFFKDVTLDTFVGSYIASVLNSYEALELVRFSRQTSDGLRQTITALRRLRDIKVTIVTPVIYAK